MANDRRNWWCSHSPAPPEEEAGTTEVSSKVSGTESDADQEDTPGHWVLSGASGFQEAVQYKLTVPGSFPEVHPGLRHLGEACGAGTLGPLNDVFEAWARCSTVPGERGHRGPQGLCDQGGLAMLLASRAGQLSHCHLDPH